MSDLETKQLACALLAERHMRLAEGVRGLLEAIFKRVYLVADTASLSDGTYRLQPNLIVLDLSLTDGHLDSILLEIKQQSPSSRIVVLTVHDDPTVASLALQAGAHGVVLNRRIGSELLLAVDRVLNGREYVSADFGLDARAI